jgi:cyclopropane fatty-acyl-phospholipid synthase-like methyltransferase
MENVNNSYFDGYYKEIWKTIIPEELTKKETEFMIQYFKLDTESKVLDIMCGYGRHAIALARKGIQVTAVDNLAAYTEEITDVAKKEELPISVVTNDVVKYKSRDTFDLVICMGNSLNFFSEPEIIELLSSLSSQIKEEGQLLIHTWSLAEIVIKDFKKQSQSEINGYKYSAEAKYLFHPTRIETDTLIISSDNIKEVKLAIDYIFSVAEMEKILNTAGFSRVEIYSIPGRTKFALGDPRAYIIAKK